MDLYSALSQSASNALPFPISRRGSPQANPTARHQRTLRDKVIRVGVSRYIKLLFQKCLLLLKLLSAKRRKEPIGVTIFSSLPTAYCSQF